MFNENIVLNRSCFSRSNKMVCIVVFLFLCMESQDLG